MRLFNLLAAALLLFTLNAGATTTEFDLTIRGNGIDVAKKLALKDFRDGNSTIQFGFEDAAGNPYQFDLKYKRLPGNRSYPSNLDVTVKTGAGEKLGYLFWANNGVEALKRIGTFGLVFDVDGKPVDVRFAFAPARQGDLSIDHLEYERFVQDTLVPKFGFQMIRPVLVPKVSDTVRSISYQLDGHPYNVNYRIENLEQGGVEFQYNLHQLSDSREHLLERVYFHADSISTLREGMFAGKYFDDKAGAFKLVFYPTMGQTSPE